ncbi:MAG: response regulator [Desulfobulbaceae bacterium]|nr:response regulator [Desulfobulbaceae bacterium]HIJ78004.1 response regulator [Deltaproteobacteria bacterium]
MRIAIVDDSGTARMFIRKCLSIIGFDQATFIESANGKEALDKLQESAVDLMVTDLAMPVMDGESLLRWLKDSPAHCKIPVLVISSAGNDAKVAELLEAGAYGVLAKPISPATLLHTLEPIIGQQENIQSEWQQIMQTAVSDTLENMAFMEAFPGSPDPEQQKGQHDWLWATLLVLKPIHQEFRLEMPMTLLREIASTVYESNIDHTLNEQHIHDLLAELLNTIAGHFLRDTMPEKTFKISTPQLGAGMPPELDINARQWHFSCDDIFFTISLYDVE